MANPPGTETAAFVTFAVLDELLRTLVERGLLPPEAVAELLDRTRSNIASMNRAAGPNAINAVEAMRNEYRK